MTSTTSAPVKSIELQAGDLRLALRPDIGGCIAGLWRGDVPVMRSPDADTIATARDAGSFALAPFSNRLGFSRFRWQGQDHRIVANVAETPHALHGVAWMRGWEVVSASGTEAELRYVHRGDEYWPFDFTLVQRFVLSAAALEQHLVFTNTGSQPQPVGLGWHPYFVKRPRSRLHVELAERWETDANQLPTRKLAQPGIDGDVAHLAFDHCFEGWRGAARIRDEKLSLKLTSSLPYLVVHTPEQRDYFCVEPVSHVSNAIHMAEPAAHGLRSLGASETTDAWMKLEIAPV
ncbi:aldose 1-epimerase [Aquincola sp. S2]|uniref:Aldose 1-epimerase n=1 Tax=Pseudaquabacterium terrae TaxID=2732868 RepID=A0ABX2EM10_9BURK|nr:aldose 1-epimerase [Aquabacterium terrae]NRF69665.1 aldose 1-epimerase [Aquabacterium terrae]